MHSLDSVLGGDRLALSRLLTQIENDTSEGREVLSSLFPYTGKAHLIGVTGAPGTGKSSLVNRLARYYRHPPKGEQIRRIAIVAVDPSSPFTGGAILGDRVRMRDLAGDSGVFIRSMASRGSLGGLANATTGFVQVFDAAGYDIIFIETVGAGQAEVDIVRLAHTTIVVQSPGLGDDIQAIKAGILEIADILVVNKADLPGVDNTERALYGMLELVSHDSRLPASTADPTDTASNSLDSFWVPPIIRTISIDGTGIPDLASAIANHHLFLNKTGEWKHRERNRFQAELESMLREALLSRWHRKIDDGHYQEVLIRLIERRISPYQAVAELLNGGAQ